MNDIPLPKVPHYRIVLAISLMAIAGYAVLSGWVVTYGHDAALLGDVTGTWKSFAVGAFAFWIGSSSGGKVKDAGPVQTTITNTEDNPVPTTTEPTPSPSAPPSSPEPVQPVAGAADDQTKA